MAGRCYTPVGMTITKKERDVSTVNLTNDTLEVAISTNDIVLVDFWAAWCGPCRMFAPVYEQASEEHPDIVFGKVDTEAQQALAGQFDIRSIPTIMAVRDGVIVFTQPGALPENMLESLIGQVRALDMDEVRAKLAASA